MKNGTASDTWRTDAENAKQASQSEHTGRG